MTEQELSLEPESDWDCKTQLDRIEEKLDRLLEHINKPKRSNNKKPAGYSADFDELWSRYPARSGGNPKSKAWGAVRSRLSEYVDIEVMAAGLDRYIAYVKAEGLEGGNFVMQAARFFGVNKEYENEWLVSKQTAAPKTDKEWSDKARELGIEARAGESWASLKERVKVALR